MARLLVNKTIRAIPRGFFLPIPSLPLSIIHSLKSQAHSPFPFLFFGQISVESVGSHVINPGLSRVIADGQPRLYSNDGLSVDNENNAALPFLFRFFPLSPFFDFSPLSRLLPFSRLSSSALFSLTRNMQMNFLCPAQWDGWVAYYLRDQHFPFVINACVRNIGRVSYCLFLSSVC